MAAGKRVAEVVGRHGLLREGGEIGSPATCPAIDDNSAILPNVIVVVRVVSRVMQIFPQRSLVQVHIMYAIALAIKAPEDIDVELILERRGKKLLQPKHGLRVFRAIDNVAVAPRARFVQEVAAEKIKSRFRVGAGEITGTRRRLCQGSR